MNKIPSPASVRTAVIAQRVREAKAPVYTSEAKYIKGSEAAKRDYLRRVEDLACGDDFCHICSRPTDHWAEHTSEQLLAWAKRPGMVQGLLNIERFDV
jgi:hypothetical protein